MFYILTLIFFFFSANTKVSQISDPTSELLKAGFFSSADETAVFSGLF